MADEAREIGSLFYGRVCELLAEDAVARGPTFDLLRPSMAHPADDYHVFRMLDGVHWLVLEGKAPALAKRYPSVGGDGDADAAWPDLRRVLADPPAEVAGLLSHPPQTNEPARSAALIVGELEVARRTGLPLRLLEIGASAGLNLHPDMFRFEAGGKGVGPEDSAVRFVDHWLVGTPSFETPLVVCDRRGCDLYPVDLRESSERTRLLSYVWPDEVERFVLNRAAVEIASANPAPIDLAWADEWVEAHLAGGLPEGQATVLFHSLVWLYLDETVRERILAALESAGATATETSPLAWLRYEQDADDKGRCNLDLRLWPDGKELRLAYGGHHNTPVTVLSASRRS
jgi:hypothetical protein